ncbi:acylphosphatase [Aquincola sp. J276]|uniref:acylphosphatase n=1 Tax=Aquincola sp. J276 TaxID=2898432 RepID=UPI00215175F6|nr:acylphosphatase [Aquincola sp. J276]MCR5864086.1 acylphosphatase [Aquincola sp. J276]
MMNLATPVRPIAVMDDPTEHRCARVRRHLQGTGYCDACVQTAHQIGLAGWVRNRGGGSVELELHDSVEQLLTMRRWLANGPALTEVRNVEWRQFTHPQPVDMAFHRRFSL